jgi:hypothetical protein
MTRRSKQWMVSAPQAMQLPPIRADTRTPVGPDEPPMSPSLISLRHKVVAQASAQPAEQPTRRPTPHHAPPAKRTRKEIESECRVRPYLLPDSDGRVRCHHRDCPKNQRGFEYRASGNSTASDHWNKCHNRARKGGFSLGKELLHSPTGTDATLSSLQGAIGTDAPLLYVNTPKPTDGVQEFDQLAPGYTEAPPGYRQHREGARRARLPWMRPPASPIGPPSQEVANADEWQTAATTVVSRPPNQDFPTHLTDRGHTFPTESGARLAMRPALRRA